MTYLPSIRHASLALAAASALLSGNAVAQRLGPEVPPVRGAAERSDRAAARSDAPRSNRHDRNAEQRALSAAVRRVESETGGQVLSAERIPFDGRDVSRIKVVDASGRVRVYMDDPQAPRGRSGRGLDRAPTRDDDN